MSDTVSGRTTRVNTSIPEPPMAANNLPPHFALRPWQGLVIGIVSAVIVWAIVQVIHPVFRVGKEFDVPSIGMPTAKFQAHRAEQDKVDRRHVSLYVGGLSALIALAMGLREGLAKRAWLMPIVSALLGAAGGALGGSLGAMILQHVRENIGQAELKHLVEAQIAVAAPLGLSIGLGVGLVTRSVATAFKTTLAGLGGGLCAAVIYPVIVSVLLPAASTEVLLPEEASTRLLWLALLSAAVGFAIPFAGRQRKPVITAHNPPVTTTA
jgi:hypothetical protein